MSSIDSKPLPNARELRAQFERRQPFRHFKFDGFFADEFARELLAQFPAFERGNARNEHGELGGKATFERIRELGPAYAAVDDLIQSQRFLHWLSASTGIPDLLYDPWYFGGGTHDNRQGQDLDAHVDFNRHPENGWHRRLNLILYLNPDWDSAWGGALQLHANPQSKINTTTIIPLCNRCVVFETTEHSWHGFSQIRLPIEKRDVSRRSLALYFYTSGRPESEIAPSHQTIYVDRPLPAHLKSGHTLSEADMQELQCLLTRRDTHIQRLYKALQDVGGSLDGAPRGHLHRLVSGLRQLFRQRWMESKPLDRALVKSAMLPFVAHLPAGVREPLRRLWRTRGRAAAPAGAHQSEPPTLAMLGAAGDARVDAGAATADVAHTGEMSTDGASTEEAAYLARVAKEN